MAEKEQILIVDDDEVTLRLAAHIFKKAGYSVNTAKNGSDGLRQVERINPDLIILDVMMPDISGLEVCKKLRSNPDTAWMPVIMLSAKSDVEDKLEGFQAGADDYVTKPVSHKELLARAGALLLRSKRVQTPSARIVSLVGVKGGVGVTTVAVNMATLLASKEKSVILAELRTNRGTVSHNLNISPAEDLGGLLSKDVAEIRSGDVMRRIARHKSGLRVLVAPGNAADYVLTEAHVHTILEAIIPQAEYIFLDLPTVAGGGMQLALEQSDQIFLVMEPEAVSIACARTDLEMIKSWGLFDRTSLLVVSRARSSNLIAPKDITKELGADVIGVLPPSPEVFYLAASLGNPAVISKPDTLVARTLVKFTNILLDRLPPGTARG